MHLDAPILVVDDENEMIQALHGVLTTAGYRQVTGCPSAAEVFPLIDKLSPGVVLLDLNMPVMSGEELLPEIMERYPNTAVIIVTGINDVSKAVSCMKNGAFDYLVKPPDPDRLLTCVRHAIEVSGLRESIRSAEKDLLADKLDSPEAFSGIITRSSAMLKIFRRCESIASGRQTILITGETGTGKEVIAGAIHRLSGRTGKFIGVNIAGQDSAMLNDSLFGHVKGAFTGAVSASRGLIGEAENGTLFLDEIGDLNSDVQIKLLRLLQEHEYLSVGASTMKQSTARILAATCRDLDQMVEEGTFRKDLYFRLTTHMVHLPPPAGTPGRY